MLIIRRPPRPPRTDTRDPYTTLFRSRNFTHTTHIHMVSLTRNWRIDCRRVQRQCATPPRLGPYLLKAVDGTGQGRSSAVNSTWTYSAKLVRQARRTSKGKAKTKSGAAYLGPRCRHCHLRTLRQKIGRASCRERVCTYV